MTHRALINDTKVVAMDEGVMFESCHFVIISRSMIEVFLELYINNRSKHNKHFTYIT